MEPQRREERREKNLLEKNRFDEIALRKTQSSGAATKFEIPRAIGDPFPLTPALSLREREKLASEVSKIRKRRGFDGSFWKFLRKKGQIWTITLQKKNRKPL